MADNDDVRNLLSPTERAEADVETTLADVVADLLNKAGEAGWQGLRRSPNMPEDDVPAIVRLEGDDTDYELEVAVTLNPISAARPAGG